MLGCLCFETARPEERPVMFRLLLLLVLAVPVAVSVRAVSSPWLRGLGVEPLTPRQQAQEQALELARYLHRLRGPDGWHLRVADPGEADPWGNPLNVEYRRQSEGPFPYEILRVRGRGPDGVWGTQDDVAVVLVIFQRAGRNLHTRAP
jgi:hypothetical protein